MMTHDQSFALHLEHRAANRELFSQIFNMGFWRSDKTEKQIGAPKKQADEYDLFAVKSKKANKTNLSVRFLLSKLTDL